MPDLSDAKPTDPIDTTLLLTWWLAPNVKARIYSDGVVRFGQMSPGVRIDHVIAMVDAYRELQAKPAAKPEPFIQTVPRNDWAIAALEQDPSGIGALTWLVMRLRDLGQDVLADDLRSVRDAIFPSASQWEAPTARPLAVGDVVRVKGQSEVMTVIGLDDAENPHSIELWTSTRDREWLPAAALEHA